jgi:hypothetical protein
MWSDMIVTSTEAVPRLFKKWKGVLVEKLRGYLFSIF